MTTGDGVELSAAVPDGPEDRQVFRLAQLTLLLEVAGEEQAPIRSVDRLGFYDFFSANPFVVLSGDDRRDVADRLTLRLAGFSDRQLSYASTGQRFASRRRRLQHDLSLLVAYGLVTIESGSYELTMIGGALAERLTSVYADAYREAARVVLKRLKRLSDNNLKKNAEEWLGKSWLLIDVLDDVAETTPGIAGRRESASRG
ncbi:ABC-three component system middle component 2 [Saccharothrix luteola]|uniref:ABC-three component system middle component 2 n=1 Tax=Saccharothrix luteola TaxID=2893018 RepID=UPI001E39F8BD|nr:ABC-three component system middle component 2 [Saccharothrix luteola]MCC8245059.1 hypothetical protein [Saccharothrix luteola]